MWLPPLPESLPAVTRWDVMPQQPNFRGKASEAAPSSGDHGATKHSQTSFVFFSFLFLFFSCRLIIQTLSTLKYCQQLCWRAQAVNADRRQKAWKQSLSEFLLGVPTSPIFIKTAWKIYLVFYICFVLYYLFIYLLFHHLYTVRLFYQFWWFGLSQLPVLFWKSHVPDHKPP